MNVLSLFDGISCARVALDRAGIKVNAYMAAEIEKNAIKVSQKNYPDIIRVGSVVDLEVEGQVDLLIGGSPCQDLSIAKKDRKGLGGDRSGLFWEYARIKKECNPQWFILENVASMPKADRDIITKEMGVEPIMFNASLVSAQSRKRLFWTNIPFTLPDDRGILLKDILQPDVGHLIKIGRDVGRRLVDGHRADADTSIPYERRIETREDDKCGTLTSVAKDNLVVQMGLMIPEATKQGYAVANEGDSVDLSFPKSKTRRGRVGQKAKNIMTGSAIGVVQNQRIRKLTPIECERLQGLPDNYTEGIAMTHRYKCLGNAFNVDVIAHILGRVKLMY
jgi:DNA (cytosine-5)-methyltransferase 3A